MSEKDQPGLSRRELEREAKWLMRSVPRDPDKLAELLVNVVITLIDKNNKAIAESFEKKAISETEEF